MWPITGTRSDRPADPRFFRIHLPSSKTDRPPDARSGGSPENHEDRALHCAVCAHEITRQRQAVTVNGRHEHAFFNPAGIAFEIRCFRGAPGAAPQGEPTGEFTWFAGYRWQIALCTACQAHLGWLFTNGSSFYGLIGSRLF